MYLCVFVQARARLDLREKATKGDAEDVVEIMKHRWNYRSLIIIVSINLFTAVKHVKWVVLLLATYVQWCLYRLYYASVWLWWHLVTISALYLSCAVLRCKMCLSPSVCVCIVLLCSLADTYSDGLGNLDFGRSQLGAGMSQRSAAKRLVNALHSHAQRTNQMQFDLQTLRSVAERMNIKVKAFIGTR